MSDLYPFIDTLRDRLSISSVVGKHVKLKRHGHEFQGLCPFHNEKTPSFTVNDRKRFYHCFGCGAHGDILSFVMDHQGIPFLEAVKQLAETAGLTMPAPSVQDAHIVTEKERLFTLLEYTCKYFEHTLANTPAALEYLENRGITNPIREKYRIGFATQKTIDVLLKKGFTGNEIVKAGIAANPKNLINRFQNRIIVPIIDRQMRVVAFGGRASQTGQEPKYINSPETTLFHKSTTLFGIPFVGKISQDNPLYVVEGYFDVTACQTKGIHAVAPLGTALTQDHMTALWRLAYEPTLCFDGDNAGQKAAIRACYNALPILKPGYSFKILTLPQGEDPDSFLKKEGVDAFKKLPSKSLSETLFDDYQQKIKGQLPEAQAKIKKELTQSLESIEDADVKSFYKQAFYELNKPTPSYTQNSTYGRDKKKEEMRRVVKPSTMQGTQQNTLSEKILLATLVNHPTLIASRAEELMGVEFKIQGSDKFLHLALESISNGEHDFDAFYHSELSGFVSALDMDKLVRVAPFIKKTTPLGDVEIGFNDVWQRFVAHSQLRKTLAEYDKKLKENFDPKTWEMLKQIQQDLLKQETA